MKKATVLLIALFAFAAFAALPNAALACGEKAEKANATQASSSSCGEKAEKATATQASSSCASKATATQASSSSCASKTTATQASASSCGSKADQASAQLVSADKACDPSACEGKFEKVSMNIAGMTCGGCEGSVKAALEKMDGVVKVKSISHETGTAIVLVDPAKMKDKSVMTTAVANKGYNAEIIPAVAMTADAATMNVGSKGCTEAEMAACAKTCTAAEKAACAAACTSKKATATAASAKTVSAEGSK